MMKKACLAITIVLFSITIIGNPIYIPPVYLYKFEFEKANNWDLIIYSRITQIDSVMVCSSTGKSICRKTAQMPHAQDFSFHIRKDSLVSNVDFNPEGDSLMTVIYYMNENMTQDSLIQSFVYGNYKNATIPKPLAKQTIQRFLEGIRESSYYCIYDSSGNFKGTVTGKIYDNHNNILTSGYFALSPYPTPAGCWGDMGRMVDDGVVINSDGSYSAPLYTLIYNLNTIKSCNKYKCEYGGADAFYLRNDTLKIETMHFSIQTDATVTMDIHILDDFVGIEKMDVRPSGPLKVFPNAVTGNLFHYEISTPVKATHCSIEMLNMNGQQIMQYAIHNNTGQLNLPSEIPNGSYIFLLHLNNKTVASTQLIVNRQ